MSAPEVRPLAGRKRFRLFGHRLASEFPFRTPLRPDPGEPDLTFSCDGGELIGPQPPPGRCVYRSAELTPEGESIGSLYRGSEGEVLRVPGVADFAIGERRITARLVPGALEELVEIRFLGSVLAYWLERRGIRALHASAVRIGEGAVAFLAGNRSGKSVLAAELASAGWQLVSDDILAVEVLDSFARALPAYPSIRLWPDAVRRFWHRPEALERVHPELDKRRLPVGDDGFGRFAPQPLRLARIYAPRRRGPGEKGGVEIEGVPASESLIELVRCSFSPRLVAAGELEPARFDSLARLARSTPMRRLVYPHGFDRLPRVREAILVDLAGS